MSAHRDIFVQKFVRSSASVIALCTAVACAGAAQEVPIILPGAPGGVAQELTAAEAVEIAESSYSPDDILFMQNMIPHHAQAVEMAALVAERTNLQELIDIAGRIDAAQSDEIAFMRSWLTERGEDAPGSEEAGHAGHGGHGGHHGMTAEAMARMGMATMAQMADLAAAEGTDFDRLFLQLMITHHEGAVNMVEDLHEKPGSAYDPILFDFTSDIVNDQVAEIERMNVLLVGLSTDPRADLKSGFEDAGEAISNLELIASLPKPAGFFDPANPAGLAPPLPQDDDAERGEDEQSVEGTEWGERATFLSFSNTDIAFFGDKMVAGNYHGFNIYQLDDGGVPELLSSVVCPGGQGDVSIVGDLLIMSVEQTRGRVDCGLQGVAEDVSPDRFRGLRIFDISDLRRPVQVGQVQTCRGSHTHSVVAGPGETGKIIVYNSGTANVRDEEELEGCIGEVAGDDRTALFRIDVIEIPVADPASARIVDSPAVFADPETGRLAGLWQGGEHSEEAQDTRRTDQCHDITVFPELQIAAGACSGNGVIFDISDPMAPTRIDDVFDDGFAYWHSATFNNDGTKVLFTDEWGGGARPRCRAHDPVDWGANAFYDIVDGELEFRSYFKLPAPQVDQENCVAHNGSVVPVPGRDIFVQAWYQGGISVIDFTDSSNPYEIAYFDRGPVHPDQLTLAGFWSTYWYDGKIYGTEIARGLDVLELTPSEHLTENEIAAAALADQGEVFNPQQQFRVTWPAEPVVARAYMDQLARTDALAPAVMDELNAALDQSEDALGGTGGDAALAGTLETLAGGLEGGGAASGLKDTLTGIAARLR